MGPSSRGASLPAHLQVETYENPEALVSGLKKLSKDNLSNLTPHPFHVWLTYSHPPVLDRIAAIRSHHQKIKAAAPSSPQSSEAAAAPKRFWFFTLPPKQHKQLC